MLLASYSGDGYTIYMKFIIYPKIRFVVVALLLLSYLFVGASAHLEAFNQLFSFGTCPEQVAQAKTTQPIPTKVCWTQYKHIPVVTKIAPTPAVIVLSLEFPQLERYDLIVVSINTLIRPNPDVSPFSSRAPPVKPAIS